MPGARDILLEMAETIKYLSKRVRQLEARSFSTTGYSCRVYNSANFTHDNSGNNVVVTFDSERWDERGMHSTTTNPSRITALVAGEYIISASVSWDNNATGSREIIIMLNGTTTIAAHRSNNLGASSVDLNKVLTTMYRLSAGDYVEVYAWQNSGGNLDILANAYYSPEFAVALFAR